MRIEITSERRAVEMSGFVRERTAIISITAPGQEQPSFSDNANIPGIFRMSFNDIASEVPGLEMPKQSDFAGLKDFLDDMLRRNTELIIVHCGAGISRSAGLGAAVEEYLGMEDDIFNNPAYIPNRLVYRLALCELGISHTQEEYEELFRAQTEAAEVQNPAYLKDPRKTVEIVMKAFRRNQSVEKAAKKAGISCELAEKIMRLVATHPGVGADGIMTRMGL